MANLLLNARPDSISLPVANHTVRETVIIHSKQAAPNSRLQNASIAQRFITLRALRA